MRFNRYKIIFYLYYSKALVTHSCISPFYPSIEHLSIERMNTRKIEKLKKTIQKREGNCIKGSGRRIEESLS